MAANQNATSADQQAQNELAELETGSQGNVPSASTTPAVGTTGPTYSLGTTAPSGGTATGSTGNSATGSTYTPPSVGQSAYEYEEYGEGVPVVLGPIATSIGLKPNQVYQVSQVIDALSSASHSAVLQFERQMNNAGLYSQAGVGAAQGQAVEEGVLDQNSIQTTIEALVSASNAGANKAGSKVTFSSWMNNLTESGAGSNENEVIPSAQVSTGNVDQLQLANPDDLYSQLYQTFESELGRAPTDSEISAFVKQYQGAQTKQQMGEFKEAQSSRFQNYQGQIASRDTQTAAQTNPRVAGGAIQTNNINSPATYADALLNYLGVPVTSNNTQALVAWINAQGQWGNGSFNPFGSDFGVSGSTTGTNGHQTYQNFQQSISAMADELQNYPYIMSALQNGNLASSMTSNSGTKAEINKITNGNGSAVNTDLTAASHVANAHKAKKLSDASHANKQAKATQASVDQNYNSMSLMQKVAVVQNAATAHGKTFSQSEENDIMDSLRNGASVPSLVQQVQNGRLNANSGASAVGSGAATSQAVSATGTSASQGLLGAVQNFVQGVKGGNMVGMTQLGQNPKPGIENQIPSNAGGNAPNPPQNNNQGGSAGQGGILGRASGFETGSNNINNPTQWAQAILSQMGAPETSSNINFLTSWAAQEGGNWNNTAKYNPLNTTLQEQGSSVMGGGNSAGVQAYNSWQQGNNATIKTLEGYKDIVSALMAGNASQADQSGQLSAAFKRWSGNSYDSISIVGGGHDSATGVLGSAAGTGMSTAGTAAQDAVPAADTSPEQNPSAPGDMFIPDTVMSDTQAPSESGMAFTDATTGANAVPHLGNTFLSAFDTVRQMLANNGPTGGGLTSG